jgi:flagellar hook-associated protein 1 FlgK
MSITRALSNAYSGLAAASARATVASNNIANANTPGYVRREVVLSERTIAGQGFGVDIAGVSRTQDLALTAERREAGAAAGRADILSRAYTELNTALGEPGDGFGLFSAYQDFENSLRELALTPESTPLQNRLQSDSARLTAEFNDLSEIARRQRNDADSAIATAVATINDNLYKIQKLNGDIAGLNEQTGEAVAFEDERQRVIDEISQYLPVTVLPRDNGRIELMTKEGVFLVSNTVNELSFTRTGTITGDMTYDNGALSGLFAGTQEITPGSTNTLAAKSGALSGYFAVRDEAAPGFLDQIDGLAADLVSRFSDDALDPTKTPGDPGLFTDAGLALDPLNTTGIASRISLNAAVDPAQGGEVYRLRDGLGAAAQGDSGDATFLNNLIGAFTSVNAAPAGTGLNGQYSALDATAGVLSSVGESRVRYDSIYSSATARAQVLADAEISKTGVDTDRELQSLLLIEQAYAANARVIQTIGTLVDRLLEI